MFEKLLSTTNLPLGVLNVLIIYVISSKNGEIKSLQSMSLYSNNLGMCIATEFIDDKSNEISIEPKLLNLFN